MQRSVVVTADGSKTIHLADWEENYHSHNGALQEAMHVFIDKVREHLGQRKEISILEMGFGTGLNAFLSCRLAEEFGVKINYVALEAFPVDFEEIQQLGYAEFWETGADYFFVLHEAEWNKEVEITPSFFLEKKRLRFEDWSAENETFDFIYFDAFSPRVQPNLWHVELFRKLYCSARIDGVFLTYCAKGQVRRDLGSVGWSISRLPGPPGKREMLLGVKNKGKKLTFSL